MSSSAPWPGPRWGVDTSAVRIALTRTGRRGAEPAGRGGAAIRPARLAAWPSRPLLGGPVGESRSYRKFSAQQKTELVLASLRGPKTIAQLCREHEISEGLLRKWREQFLAAGAERLSGKAERTEADELRRQVSRAPH